jgi:hypothetical protein
MARGFLVVEVKRYFFDYAFRESLLRDYWGCVLRSLHRTPESLRGHWRSTFNVTRCRTTRTGPCDARGIRVHAVQAPKSDISSKVTFCAVSDPSLAPLEAA